MGKEFCEDCPHRENCFVREKQQFYSYGFYERKLALAHRRKRLDNPAEKEFLNLRAGAESLVNEVYYQDGEKARFTGTIKVKNASIAKAIGTNSSEPHDSWNRRRSGSTQRDSRRRREFSRLGSWIHRVGERFSKSVVVITRGVPGGTPLSPVPSENLFSIAVPAVLRGRVLI